MALADIDTIVIVILENRSFDHMLGYLGIGEDPAQQQVDGVSSDPTWLGAYANRFGGRTYASHRIGPQVQAIADPKHDHAAIGIQIETAPADANLQVMGGFVQSYVEFASSPPADPSLVMGYYDQEAVPVFDFLARNFMVCDHWFAALPTGTQPNRLMAMSGEAPTIDNAAFLMADEPLVYDWLNQNGVSWCAYQWGDFLPFFSLMPKMLEEMVVSLTASDFGGRGHFRRYGGLASHWMSNEPMPSVIFIEPEYSDGPHFDPCDDHCPTGVAKGQAVVGDIYNTLVSNPRRWAKTLMLVTYDEHGGFYDHVAPLPITTTVAGHQFATTGVRVPALLISPQIAPGTVFKGPLDHTSILQMLADRFTPGAGYSVPVNARQASLDRLANALAAPNGGQPARSIPQDVIARLGDTAATVEAPTPVGSDPADPPNAKALHQATVKAATDHPGEMATPGWAKVQAYLAQTTGQAPGGLPPRL